MNDISEFIEKLASPDEADRMYAAEDIGYANLAAGVDPLLARLSEEPSRAVSEAIFGALLQIDGDAVNEGMLKLLRSDDSFLRNQAVEILRMRGERAIPYLDRAFRDESADCRKFVIDVLARLGDFSGTAEIYKRALQDPDLNVVITAVEGLGSKRQVSFRGQIEALITRDTHPMLLSACLEALVQIGDAGSIETIRTRLGATDDLPGYLQPPYLKLLGAVGGPETAGEIAGRVGRDGLEEPVLNALTALRNRFPGLELPADLAPALQNVVSKKTSPLLSYQAVRLLGGLLRDEAVFDFVECCLSDPEKSVRIGAVQSMREASTLKAEAAIQQRLNGETDEEVLQVLTGRSAE